MVTNIEFGAFRLASRRGPNDAVLDALDGALEMDQQPVKKSIELEPNEPLLERRPESLISRITGRQIVERVDGRVKLILRDCIAACCKPDGLFEKLGLVSQVDHGVRLPPAANGHVELGELLAP